MLLTLAWMFVPSRPVTCPLYAVGLDPVPSVTALDVMWTPPPSSGWPSIRMFSVLSDCPESASGRSTRTSPPDNCDWLTVPVTGAVNALGGRTPAPELETEPAVEPVVALTALAFGSSELGVPARLAQPDASGPVGNQISSATGAAIEANSAAPRAPM